MKKTLKKVENNLSNVIQMKAYMVQRQKTMLQEQEHIEKELSDELDSVIKDMKVIDAKFVQNPVDYKRAKEVGDKKLKDLRLRISLTGEAIAELKKNLNEVNELELQ